MKPKIYLGIAVIATIFAGATYAAASGSLWGAVDEPLPELKPSIKAATKPEVKPAVQTTAVTVTAPPVVVLEAEPEKTMCDVLRQQTELPADLVNSPAIQEQLKSKLQIVSAEYKAILNSSEATNTLYKQYREQYLQKNCKL